MELPKSSKVAQKRLGRHLTHEEAEKYAKGEVAGPEADSLMAHIASCQDCGRRNYWLKKKFETW